MNMKWKKDRDGWRERNSDGRQRILFHLGLCNYDVPGVGLLEIEKSTDEK